MLSIVFLVTFQSSIPLPFQGADTLSPPVRLGIPLVEVPSSPLIAMPPQVISLKAAGKPDPVLAWNSMALEVIRLERSTPLMASRNLAILHAAIYDAVNSIRPTHKAFRYQITAPADALPEVAAAVAAHRVLVGLYPRYIDRFDEVLDRCLDSIAESSGKRAGLTVGFQIAEKMLAWRDTDTSNKSASAASQGAPGQWVPTPPDYKPALLPQWSKVPCFCMKSSSQFRPPPPPPLTSQAYANAYDEVKALGATLSPLRTQDQTEVAWFWVDGEGTSTPPGHWNQIAQVVARARGTSLEENARLFALLNLTLADAGIMCWDCKYHYALWRPVTAIRQAARVGNPNTQPDEDWTPLVPTPAFPSYTSGHSSFSSSGARILAAYFGSDEIAFASRSDQLPGVVRRFQSFSSAADEAGRSRIYGGIHYQFDHEAGVTCGRALADYVFNNFLVPLQVVGTLRAPLNHP